MLLYGTVMKWGPPGRRKRDRPKATWAEGIRGLMGGGGEGLMEEEWNETGSWRKKTGMREAAGGRRLE